MNPDKLLKMGLPLFLCISLGIRAYAQRSVVRTYDIFHPVPPKDMRDMETDRPDVTESAFTVDAGHSQYESDLVRLELQGTENGRQQTVLLHQFFLKAGLSRSTEVQLGLQSFGFQRETDNGQIAHSRGIGNTTIRLKQNLKGNDAGKFVLALLPYLRFPSSRFEQSRYEYGLIVPMQAKLPGDWKLGFQLEADRLKDESTSGMHTELLQSLTLSHELLKGLEGIAESYYTYDFKEHHWSNFLNAAVQLEISKGIKIDGGLNYGIQHDATRSYFLGSSLRF